MVGFQFEVSLEIQLDIHNYKKTQTYACAHTPNLALFGSLTHHMTETWSKPAEDAYSYKLLVSTAHLEMILERRAIKWESNVGIDHR